MFTFLRTINSKILLKIMILIIIEAILIVGSFGVLAYFQSQQSSLGNSINIAGKNRFLTASVLLQTEKSLYGLSSDISQLTSAMNSLQSNIITLKQGGMISGVDLKPLPSNFMDLWNTVDDRWNGYKTFTDKLLASSQTSTATITDKSIKREAVESMASNLIETSDKLVTVLGQQTDKNSQNLLLLQILFAFLIIGILVLILYLVTRMLRPIFALTQATSKVKNGILDVSVKQKGSDELSILSECFNSMIDSIRDHNRRQTELTKQLEAANEELKQKDRLKDEFINVAAHELRTPIQPILGLSEVLRSRKVSDMGLNIADDEFLSIIIRNAKRLQQLSADILDIAKIEGHTLILKKEQFDVNEIISDAVVDYRNQTEKDGKNRNEWNLLYKNSGQDICIEADKGRITQVISNLVSNAVKFTKVGTVTVSAEKVEENDRQQVIISIKDTGTGIDPEMLPKLFTKFATKSDKGTGIGLGLFISKSIVEAHGGRIWAENNKDGKGATFAFSMPINKQQQLISSSSLGSK
ncbi:MAG TPA: HAMP domain-containing sensor histidine kinase [Nitrososphaeraceae archaeon]